MEKVIKAKNLSKEYNVKNKRIYALKNCSFEIKEGTCIGYIGLNGSGKSTTIKLLTGIMKASAGGVEILGVDPFTDRKKIMSKIGVLFGQRSNLVYDLPLKNSFELLAAVYGLSVDEYNNQLVFLKKYIDFDSLWDTPVRQMSLGQRMRCEVASVLIHNPKIVFFDEAFLGIDYSSKNMIKKLIDACIEKNNTTFFITSHDLRDIEKMCKEIIIINHGEIVEMSTVYAVKKKSLWRHLELSFDDDVDSNILFSKELFKDAEIKEVDGEEKTFSIRIKKDNIHEIISLLSDEYSLMSYKIYDCSLEEIIEGIYSERGQE